MDAFKNYPHVFFSLTACSCRNRNQRLAVELISVFFQHSGANFTPHSSLHQSVLYRQKELLDPARAEQIKVQQDHPHCATKKRLCSCWSAGSHSLFFIPKSRATSLTSHKKRAQQYAFRMLLSLSNSSEGRVWLAVKLNLHKKTNVWLAVKLNLHKKTNVRIEY